MTRNKEDTGKESTHPLHSSQSLYNPNPCTKLLHNLRNHIQRLQLRPRRCSTEDVLDTSGIVDLLLDTGEWEIVAKVLELGAFGGETDDLGGDEGTGEFDHVVEAFAGEVAGGVFGWVAVVMIAREAVAGGTGDGLCSGDGDGEEGKQGEGEGELHRGGSTEACEDLVELCVQDNDCSSTASDVLMERMKLLKDGEKKKEGEEEKEGGIIWC